MYRPPSLGTNANICPGFQCLASRTDFGIEIWCLLDRVVTSSNLSDFRQFLLRGLDKVRGEWSLVIMRGT